MGKRKRKKPKADNTTADLPLTPMIDVVFLLLIFFMCATKFKVPDYRIDAALPRDKGLRAVQVKPPKDIPEFRLTIDPVQGKEDAATFRLGRRTMVPLQQLNEMVKAHYWEIKQNPEYQGEKIPAVIDGQAEVDFKFVVMAINACIAANVDEINFAPPIPDDIRGRMGNVK